MKWAPIQWLSMITTTERRSVAKCKLISNVFVTTWTWQSVSDIPFLAFSITGWELYPNEFRRPAEHTGTNSSKGSRSFSKIFYTSSRIRWRTTVIWIQWKQGCKRHRIWYCYQMDFQLRPFWRLSSRFRDFSLDKGFEVWGVRLLWGWLVLGFFAGIDCHSFSVMASEFFSSNR